MKFLIVDDDDDILRMTTKLLEMYSYEVVTASNALDAIDLLNNDDIDILITDATMPEYSGFDLIHSLKRNKKFSKLCIAMLTGRKDREDIEQAIDLGVQDYIVIPIDPEVLLKKIDILTQRHAQRLDKIRTIHAPTAKMSMDVKVVRVTDVGVAIESPVHFTPGNLVELEIAELTKYLIFKKKFKALYSKKASSNFYCTEFILLDLSFDEKERLQEIAHNWGNMQKAG